MDDEGEGGLDGVAVLERGEFELEASGAAGRGDVAEGGVATVEAVVEEAEGVMVEGGRTALGSVGLDVAAELILHG